jgi:hypothetical protein
MNTAQRISLPASPELCNYIPVRKLTSRKAYNDFYSELSVITRHNPIHIKSATGTRKLVCRERNTALLDHETVGCVQSVHEITNDSD